MTATPKLMLVEHDPYFIYLIKLYAEQSGFSVITTTSGIGALAMAQREHPSVIILEFELPEINGWEVLNQLRAEPRTQAIPVVMCLWQDSQYVEGDCEGLLHKPLDYGDFVAALKVAGVWPPDRPSDHRRLPPTEP